MAGNQQFQLQLEALKELENRTWRVHTEAVDVLSSYQNAVTGLRESGLTEEIYQKFDFQFLTQIESQKIKIIAISEQAVQFVRGYIQVIEQLMG